MSSKPSKRKLTTSNKDNKLSFSFTEIDNVFGRIDLNGSKRVTFVVFGTMWSFPALTTLETISPIQQPDIDIYLVDQDACPEYCEQQGIIIGSPAVMIFYERAPMHIMRPKSNNSVSYYSGQMNKDNFKSLILLAQSAATKEAKGDAPRTFRVPF